MYTLELRIFEIMEVNNDFFVLFYIYIYIFNFNKKIARSLRLLRVGDELLFLDRVKNIGANKFNQIFN